MCLPRILRLIVKTDHITFCKKGLVVFCRVGVTAFSMYIYY